MADTIYQWNLLYRMSSSPKLNNNRSYDDVHEMSGLSIAGPSLSQDQTTPGAFQSVANQNPPTFSPQSDPINIEGNYCTIDLDSNISDEEEYSVLHDGNKVNKTESAKKYRNGAGEQNSADIIGLEEEENGPVYSSLEPDHLYHTLTYHC